MRAFADTGFWYAFSTPRDQHHKAAAKAARESPELITTISVVIETATLFQRRGAFDIAVTFLESMRTGDIANVIYPTTSQFERVISEFSTRGASGATIVDCISFVVMRDLHVTRAFTFDDHFRAAGFRIL